MKEEDLQMITSGDVGDCEYLAAGNSQVIYILPSGENVIKVWKIGLAEAIVDYWRDCQCDVEFGVFVERLMRAVADTNYIRMPAYWSAHDRVRCAGENYFAVVQTYYENTFEVGSPNLSDLPLVSENDNESAFFRTQNSQEGSLFLDWDGYIYYILQDSGLVFESTTDIEYLVQKVKEWKPRK